MNTVKLITDDQLTNGSPLGGNIDVDKYSYVILETQVFVIEPILGTKLYNKLLSDFNNDTLEGVYETLLINYIQPIIISHVSAEYISMAGIHVANAGLYKYNPENTESVSIKEREHLAQKQRAKADVYIERLQRFLCDSTTDIDEYDLAQDNNFDVKPDRDLNTYGGWRLSNIREYGSSAEREIWRDILNDEGR